MATQKAQERKTVTVSERRDLDYSCISLNSAIDELQEILNLPTVDPKRTFIITDYTHEYYGDISIERYARWEYERPETDKEMNKRLKQLERTKQKRKQQKEETRQKEIELRDKLLKKYPIA